MSTQPSDRDGKVAEQIVTQIDDVSTLNGFKGARQLIVTALAERTEECAKLADLHNGGKLFKHTRKCWRRPDPSVGFNVCLCSTSHWLRERKRVGTVGDAIRSGKE